MGANRTRIRELADSQPILLIRTNSQFAKADLRVGESETRTYFIQWPAAEIYKKNKNTILLHEGQWKLQSDYKSHYDLGI